MKCEKAYFALVQSRHHEKSFLHFGRHSILTSYHRAFCRKLCYVFKDATQRLNLACWFSLVSDSVTHEKKSRICTYSFIFVFQLLTCFVTWKSVNYRGWPSGKKKKQQIHWLCLISILYSSNVRFISIFMLNHLCAFPYHFLHPNIRS